MLCFQAKDKIHAAFKNAVGKITGVWKKNAALEEVDKEADKKIDDAVGKSQPILDVRDLLLYNVVYEILQGSACKCKL